MFAKKYFLRVGVLGIFLSLLLLVLPAQIASADDGRQLYLGKGTESLKAVTDYYALDLELVAAMNNIPTDTKLQKGQKIWLPLEPVETITVESGDSLWELAKENGTQVKNLLYYNNIKDPSKLAVGQVLKIPQQDSVDSLAVSIRQTTVTASRSGSKTTTKTQTASRTIDTEFSWPVTGIITSPYGPRKGGFHHGIDIATASGTDVKAAKAGIVTTAGWYSSIYGNAILLDHGDGTTSFYAHLSEILVKIDEKVKKGEVIGEVGETGNATGPHLHLEIRVDGEIVNPRKYL